MKAGTLCALASGKAFPCAWIKALYNLFRLACPRAKVMVRFHAENVAFAGPAQSLLNVTNPIYRVRCDPRERDVGRQRPLYNLNCQGWLGGEIYKFRNMGCGKSCRITRPALRQIQGMIDKRVAASRIPPASISPRNRIPTKGQQMSLLRNPICLTILILGFSALLWATMMFRYEHITGYYHLDRLTGTLCQSHSGHLECDGIR